LCVTPLAGHAETPGRPATPRAGAGDWLSRRSCRWSGRRRLTHPRRVRL